MPLNDVATSARVAVVGAGPAGMFTAMHLLKKVPDVAIDVFDANPTPFGLLRHGVAPDHLKMKSLANGFGVTLAHPSVSFFGNVRIGHSVSVAQLHCAYDAVVFAHGAPLCRSLGVPGEDLPGSIPAGRLVSWYNCDPNSQKQPPLTLPVDEVVVVGAGNVALDVSRILLVGRSVLHETDVPTERLDALGNYGAANVTILCRRGVCQTRFTLAELLELERIPGVRPVVDPADLAFSEADHDALAASPQLTQVADVFRRWATPNDDVAQRCVRFRFYTSPHSIIGQRDVEGVTVRTRSGDIEDLAAQAIVTAIGFRGSEVTGLAFDDTSAVVPNDQGRVAGAPATYVVGWAKRGPRGVMGSNKQCARETVDALVADITCGIVGFGASGVEALDLSLVVDKDGWSRISEAEVAVGMARGCARVKLGTREELLTAAHMPS